MDAGRKAAKKILGGYPDYGKAPPEYIIGFAEALAHLTPEELDIVTSPRIGVATRCQFLPTIADIHATLREHRAKAEQFTPAPTIYKRLNDDHGPWEQETDFERKKRVVREYLGYNPDDAGRPAPARTFTPPTTDDLANLKLKTPPARASQYLIAKLQAEGWPYFAPFPPENKTDTHEEKAA